MAYFPNGTAGDILDQQCAKCLHHNPDIGCPISFVQTHYNYDQCDDGLEKMQELLNILVNEKGICQMKPLIEKYLPDSRQATMTF